MPNPLKPNPLIAVDTNVPLDSFEFTVNVSAFVKREPPAQADRFAWRTVRELRVGVKARDLFVGPTTVAGRPCGDDPAQAIVRVRDSVRQPENFVGQRLSGKAGSGLQHHAILHAQASEFVRRSVAQP
jgi:hypothetical protein